MMSSPIDPPADDDKAVHLDRLLKRYSPKQRPRTRDKALAKQILSLRQGLDGLTGECFLCHKRGSAELDLQIHHLNGVISENALDNLALAHQRCNNLEYARRRSKVGGSDIPETVRESGHLMTADVEDTPLSISDHPPVREKAPAARRPEDAAPSLKEWSSEEGRRHELMRFLWNRWLYHAHGQAGKPGLLFNQGARISKSGLARQAVHALGMGSSVTYTRYVEEDIAGGYLEEYREGDMRYVERTSKPFVFRGGETSSRGLGGNT